MEVKKIPCCLILVVFLSSSVSAAGDVSSADCTKTIGGGPKVNATCVYPFTFRGRIYTTCATEGDPQGKAWCSTKTYANTTHIGGRGNWGYCDPRCPNETAAEATARNRERA